MRKLDLSKDTLTELSADDLAVVVGGADSMSCPVTYTCVNVSNTCQVSNGCVNVTNYCTSRVGGGC